MSGAIKEKTMNGDHGGNIVQVFSSDVRFQCPACSAFVETRMEVPEPNWTAAESLSELYSEDISHVFCSDCGNEFEVYVYFTHGDCTASFQEFSDATIDVDEPNFWPPQDEWTDPGKTPDPYAVYNQSYKQLRDLVIKFGEPDGHSIINRMIFAQHVSAMEAYLCDTRVNAVSDKRESLLKLISADPALQKAKISLTDVVKGEDVAKTYVVSHLKEHLYHNLRKVDSLYRSALGFSILANGDDTKALLAAVKLRHDCVHRNGFDTEGNPPTAFTQEYVSQTAEVIKRLVERVDTSVHEF